jgi:hypothetical protein
MDHQQQLLVRSRQLLLRNRRLPPISQQLLIRLSVLVGYIAGSLATMTIALRIYRTSRVLFSLSPVVGVAGRVMRFGEEDEEDEEGFVKK